jgi:hypothetical protein
MTSLDGVDEGDEVKVTVRKEDTELRVAKEDIECKVLLDDDDGLSDGQETNVTGKVTKAIYDTDNHVQMLIVDVESTARTRKSKQKEKSASWQSSDSSNPSASSTTGSRGRSQASSRSSLTQSSKKRSQSNSLDKIAEELIGDEELEVDREDESIVGAAKQRAKDQQRDPAIDPNLPDGE